MRRCLDCPRLIARGSRCPACQRTYEQQRPARRSSYARGTWANEVKRRDGYRCQRCGGAGRVEAHHIRPLAQGGENSISNGVTLCAQCHREAHRAIAEGAA